MSILNDEILYREYEGIGNVEFEWTANGGTFIVDPSTGKRRCNGGDRGNSRDRRNRKWYLLRTFGNGTRCRCVHCNRWLTFATMTVDRIIPGALGGTYRYDNCQPSCDTCNKSRGDMVNWRPHRVYSPNTRLTA